MALVNAGHKLGGDWVPSHPRIYLRRNVTPNDKMFEFEIEDFDLKALGGDLSQKKSNRKTTIFMLCIRITNKNIILSSENIRPTRMTEEEPEKFLCLSFANLNFCELKNGQKLTSIYIRRVLTNGIKLNDTLYEFCGHSNSQLQSRCCYLRVSYSTPIFFGLRQQAHSMDVLVNKNGNFRDIKDVSKCSKRIALLFTSSISNFTVNSKDTKLIKDIVKQDKNFTDGCGFIDSAYAEKIVNSLNANSSLKNKSDISVLQIRYKGCKGILTSIPEHQIQQLLFEDKNIITRIFLWILNSLLNIEVEEQPKSAPKILFRKSMEKFQRCDKETLCIVDHSKPFTYGYLNAELITLLATLKIPDSVFKNKLTWYLDLLQNCSSHVNSAIELSIFKNKFHMLNQLKEVSKSKGDPIPRELRPQLNKLQNDEKDYFYKDGKVKPRILVPKSRLLFGVCDPTGKLKEGECFVRYTDTVIRGKNYNIYNHQKIEKLIGKIIVTRNPCLHPGDIQHFNAVNIPELNCLVDCIVFSVHGGTPAASMMSGGDLDGDKFFVCWDPELIPRKIVPPEDYSKYTPNSRTKENITQKDLILHFSNYNTFQLGQIKFLHSKWVEGKSSRAESSQCIQLNRLHSKCVDGGRVAISKYLKKFPSPTKTEFILKTLEREIINVFPCATLAADEDVVDLDDWDDAPDEMEISNETISLLSKVLWVLVKNALSVLKGVAESIYRLF